MNSLNKEINTYFEKIKNLNKQGRLFKEKDTERLFVNLLESVAHSKNLYLRSDYQYFDYGKNIKPDATIFTLIGIPFGLYEAKDHRTNLNKEIEAKIISGYPLYNIIFENSKQMILYQNNKLILDIDPNNKKDILHLLENFFSYESKEFSEFNKSLIEFKTNIPSLVENIRSIFDKSKLSKHDEEKLESFRDYCKITINPAIKTEDIREMIVQHILTVDIFNMMYQEFDFIKYNELAKQLDQLVSTFFDITAKKNLLNKVHSFYENVSRNASNITDYQTKKKFLINFYENFYQSYNPKGADRLGIVYTPIEVVNFMIKSTDFLLKRHFNKELSDKETQILDPCTGTGTFITELIEYLYKNSKKANRKTLDKKYKSEIFCNEISILPYYIATLSIEKVYYENTKIYTIFNNISLVDTLENYKQNYDRLIHDYNLHLIRTDQNNLTRIEHQNKQKISVILGNPPYNANQQNANDDNKNRKYPEIDKRIKASYIKLSNSKKTKVYDMYARFIRYATDRIEENGIVCFITNNSYIDSKTFDGFRKSILKEFDFLYILNLGGSAIETTKKTGGNIFGIKLGVAICFLIKIDSDKKQGQLNYAEIDDKLSREEKLNFLKNTKFTEINFKKLNPKGDYWINEKKGSYANYVDLYNENKKIPSIFHLYKNSVPTNRDYWVYDFDTKNLEEKTTFFINYYNSNLKSKKPFNNEIKWSDTLKSHFNSGRVIPDFSKSKVAESYYRPFTKKYYYYEKMLSDRITKDHFEIYGENLDNKNPTICISKGNKKFECIGTSNISDLALLKFGNGGTVIFPYYIEKDGNRIENITNEIQNTFQTKLKIKNISKESIFYYIYAIFHNQNYRKINSTLLERNLPKIPIDLAFTELSKLGQRLFELHSNFENADKFPIKVSKLSSKNEYSVALKFSKDKKSLIVDTEIIIENIPLASYDYRVGNLSPIEWLVKTYRPLSPSKKDLRSYPKIFSDFNNFENEKKRFRKGRIEFIDLISKLITVSTETVKLENQINSIKIK